MAIATADSARQSPVVTPSTDKTEIDPLGVREYRAGPVFFAGYAVLFSGLLFFDWNPRFVFLGVAVDLALGVTGNIVRAFISPRGVAAVIAVVFHLPALLIAMVFAAFTMAGIALDSGGRFVISGLLMFLASSVYNSAQRFLRTSLKQARFMDQLNGKYRFEDGRPLFSKTALALGPIIETWLSTVVFAISWGIAILAGSVVSATPSGVGAHHAAALTMAVLCLIRHLVQAQIVKLVHGKGDRQEAVMVGSLRRAGRIVERSAPLSPQSGSRQ